MKKSIFTAITLSVLAAGSAASAVTPGEAQLAAAVGVEPGAYSASELARLETFQRENDAQGIEVILSRSNAAVANTDTVGLRQFALTLGVEPGKYTAAELNAIESAIRENDMIAVSLIKNTADGTDNDINSKVPMATYLGVNPDDYTRLELAKLYAAAQPDN